MRFLLFLYSLYIFAAEPPSLNGGQYPADGIRATYARMETLQREIAELRQQNSPLNSLQAVLQYQYYREILEDRIRNLNQDHQRLRAFLEKQTEGLKTSQTQCKEAETKVHDLTDQLIRTQTQANGAARHISELENYNQYLRSLPPRLQNEIQQLRAQAARRISELENYNQYLRSLPFRLQDEIQQLRAQIVENELTITQLRTALEKAEASIATRDSQNENQKNELKIAHKDKINELTTQRTKDIATLSDQLSTAQKHIVRLRSEKETSKQSYEETIHRLDTQLTNTEKDKSQARKQWEEAQAEITKLQTQLEIAQEKIATKQTSLTRKIQELTEQLKSSQSDLQRAQTDFEKKERDLQDDKIAAERKHQDVLEQLHHTVETLQRQHDELKTQTQRREMETFTLSTIPAFKSHIISNNQNEIGRVLNHYKNNPEALKLLMDILKINAFYIRWNETQAKALLTLSINEENLKLTEDLFDSVNLANSIAFKKIEALMNKVDLFKTPVLLTALYYLHPSHKMIHVIEQVFKYLSSKLSKEKLATYDEAFTEALPILYLLGKTFGNFTQHKAKLTFIYETVFNLPNEATKSEKQLWLTLMNEEFIKKNLSLTQNKQENEAVEKMQKLLQDYPILPNMDSDDAIISLHSVLKSKGMLLPQSTFPHILLPTEGDLKAPQEREDILTNSHAAITPLPAETLEEPQTTPASIEVLPPLPKSSLSQNTSASQQSEKAPDWNKEQKTLKHLSQKLKHNDDIIQILQKYKDNPKNLKSLGNILGSNALYLNWTPAQAKQLLEIFTTKESLKIIDNFNSQDYLTENGGQQSLAQKLRNEIDLFKNPVVLAALYYAYSAKKLIPVIYHTLEFLYILPNRGFFNYENDFMNAFPFLYVLGQTSGDFIQCRLMLARIYETALNINNENIEEKQLWLNLLTRKLSRENPLESESTKELIRNIMAELINTYHIENMPSCEENVIRSSLYAKTKKEVFHYPMQYFIRDYFLK